MLLVNPASTMFVAGEWRAGNGETVAVASPYTGDEIAQVARAGAGEAIEAVDAAQAALATPFHAHERAQVLEETARLLAERQEDLAHLIALEAGKPVKASLAEVDRAAHTFRFAALEARRLSGEVVPMDAHPGGVGRFAYTLREPIGVVGAITPFNFPLNLVAHKLAPALAAGCPVVLKPARATPLSALRLAELMEEAGLPPGFLSVVVGNSGELGDVLVQDPRVKLITFTGSGAVGWGLKERAPRKVVLLELGNNSPAIVAADAGLDKAADKLAANAFGYAGQTCISVQRLFVEKAVYGAFLERFVARVDQLTVGDPLDRGTDVGPVITEGERDRVVSWIEEAETQGARIVRGGAVRADGVIEPTVLTDVDPRSKVACQEVFGPVVNVDPCEDVDDGLARANASDYGLQAAIFTRDINRAFDAARRLEYGGVIVNDAPSFRVDQMPYGGVKGSGNTKEGPRYAIEHMTETKLVVVNLE